MDFPASRARRKASLARCICESGFRGMVEVPCCLDSLLLPRAVNPFSSGLTPGPWPLVPLFFLAPRSFFFWNRVTRSRGADANQMRENFRNVPFEGRVRGQGLANRGQRTGKCMARKNNRDMHRIEVTGPGRERTHGLTPRSHQQPRLADRSLCRSRSGAITRAGLEPLARSTAYNANRVRFAADKKMGASDGRRFLPDRSLPNRRVSAPDVAGGVASRSRRLGALARRRDTRIDPHVD